MNERVILILAVICGGVIAVLFGVFYLRQRARELEDLESQDLVTALNVIHRVASSEDPIPTLMKGLNHPHQSVRIEAAKVLAQLGSQERSMVLAECLKRLDLPCGFDKGNAINILGELKFIEAIPKLVQILGVEDHVGDDGVVQYPCQSAAATALSKMGERALPELMRAMQSENVQSRRYAILGLKRMGSAGTPATEELQKLLKYSDWVVRQYAAEALQEFKRGLRQS
jgi:HEAT repeat protein